MKKKALVVLADGFEEMEAVTPVDILRRSEVDVIIAGLGKLSVRGAHNIVMEADVLFGDYEGFPDAVILPGGMPGAENLANSEKLRDMFLKMNSEKRLIAAICAAPALLLAPTGVLKGREATCYPGMEKSFSSDVKFTNEEVVRSGNIITSRGPGTAFVFALKIVEALAGEDRADTVGRQTLFRTSV